MVRDDYFSFGDEDLEEAGFDAAGDVHPGQGLALAEADEIRGGEGGNGFAAKRAQRSRGDSEKRSSEKRGPSSRRSQFFVAGVLGLLAVALIYLVVSALGGGGSPPQGWPGPTDAPPATEAGAGLSDPRHIEEVRASRERDAGRERARHQRAQTRRRARRRRQRAATRRRRAEARQARRERARAAVAPEPAYEAPASEYSEPVAPPSPPAPAPPSSGGHAEEGSSSAEFAL